jgi:hypothetical protein
VVDVPVPVELEGNKASRKDTLLAVAVAVGVETKAVPLVDASVAAAEDGLLTIVSRVLIGGRFCTAQSRTYPPSIVIKSPANVDARDEVMLQELADDDDSDRNESDQKPILLDERNHRRDSLLPESRTERDRSEKP